MRIYSIDDFMIALPTRPLDPSVNWQKGSHYAHVVGAYGKEIDVFSFAWEKDRPSMLDFTTALVSYLSEE